MTLVACCLLLIGSERSLGNHVAIRLVTQRGRVLRDETENGCEGDRDYVAMGDGQNPGLPK